ncbi:MAG TPA: dienelactone hydrolase family protein [Gammaproteobacteria bacterium]|jgi:dienelactone hydrolase
MKTWMALLALLCLPIGVQAGVVGEELSYESGGTTFTGYLAYDDGLTGKRPGVLVVHEWWGHNDYVRERARMLAQLGYTALALDMYGEGKVAQHPDDAGKFAGAVRSNMAEAEARFRAALALLRNHATVDGGKVAAIGYCFGGGVVLEMARRGLDLPGVVSFHGSLGTDSPAEKGDILARILVLNGADDPYVPAEQVAAFKAEMDAAGADYRLISYPGAVHAFTNPQADDFGKRFDMPLAYNAEADRQSWAEMQRFFTRIFGE